MFGDFVEDELENKKPTTGETDVEEEETLEEDSYTEEYSEEEGGEEIDDEDKTPYQILM
jgi:hypothetical protein